MHRGWLQTAHAAEVVGSTRRTVLADLKALSAHVPLTAHPDDPRDTTRMWQLSDTWRKAGVEVRLSERLALLLGKEVLAPLLGASDVGRALEVLDRELGGAATAVDDSGEELLRRFYFVQEPSKSYAAKGELLSELVTAIANSYEVSFAYRSASATEARARRVQPLTLVIYRRGLYAFVRDPGGTPYTCAVDRMTDLVPHPDASFDYPTRGKWDPQKHLRHRFGLTAGSQDKPQRVRLRFPPESRTYALERQWMPKQRVEGNADGGVDIIFEATGYELPHRILEWGGFCEVIEPAELRDKVIDLARRVLERHGAR